MAWKQYLKEKEIDNDLEDEPSFVDEWKSSIGEITLKNMYYISRSDELLGAVFFVINGKYQMAYLNNGRNLVKYQEDNKLDNEFNQQLTSFNYIHAKRIMFDPRKSDLLM